MAASLDAGDPGGPIQLEVERGMQTMIEQHSTWLELCAAGQRGEEFDWRTAELLSCLRAIEWDLQDLEDAVSIVEGNRKKFSLDDAAVQSGKDFIEMIRNKIEAIRTSVQDSSKHEGHAAAKKGLGAKLAISAAKGYGKLPKELGADGSQEGAISPTGSASGNGGGGGMSEDVDDPRRRRRKWYAWCC